ncbi:hypothetical protein K437DRAFT_268267 [Tilletiaria anomala UBC 951]|uniref:Uncharacterized protein n=1 Tax=Tilletiaria anomala (strain ATCC 24038 / CBS 436.72 / UBC 951) TaxID=1037660 RepID=A0A066W4G4_TILAU|nr:uncharacterized protein K437DRAFT_268267 [Tilletiaria anomala UBC 951]KDN45964.1 hypothetical protein K437DRAFT_268267 [Tilletiaria anomala UBC 951]
MAEKKAAAGPTEGKLRVVPGAPSTSASSTAAEKKRSKKQGQQQPAIENKKQAALIEALPNNVKQVKSERLKAELQTLGEQAEKHAAVAAFEAVNDKNNAGEHMDGSTLIPRNSIAALINKRLKAVNKKLQRVTSYESQAPESLNADQKRIIQSKHSLLAVQSELQEILHGLEAVEKEDAIAIESEIKERTVVLRATAEKEASEQTITLLQFLHLFALFNPHLVPGIDTLAPQNSLPRVLQEQSTGAEAAALGFIFEQLALGPLEQSTAAKILGLNDGALDIVRKLRDARESSEVIQGVGYDRVREMIHQLAATPADLQSHAAPAFGGEALPEAVPAKEGDAEAPVAAEGEAASSAPINTGAMTFGSIDISTAPGGGIKFMQDSEIEPIADNTQDSSPTSALRLGQPEEVEATEPEGETVEGLEAGKEAVQGAVSEQTGGGGKLSGSIVSVVADQGGSVKGEVAKPITTTEVGALSSNLGDLSLSAPVDWAEDFNEQPEAPSVPPADADAQEQQMPIRAANGYQGDQLRKPRQPQPPKKPQPQVDEDGFTLLTSKRLAQQDRGRGRGRGRISYAGRGSGCVGDVNSTGRPHRSGDKEKVANLGQGQTRERGSASRGTQPTRGRGKPRQLREGGDTTPKRSE